MVYCRRVIDNISLVTVSLKNYWKLLVMFKFSLIISPCLLQKIIFNSFKHMAIY